MSVSVRTGPDQAVPFVLRFVLRPSTFERLSGGCPTLGLGSLATGQEHWSGGAGAADPTGARRPRVDEQDEMAALQYEVALLRAELTDHLKTCPAAAERAPHAAQQPLP